MTTKQYFNNNMSVALQSMYVQCYCLYLICGAINGTNVFDQNDASFIILTPSLWNILINQSVCPN